MPHPLGLRQHDRAAPRGDFSGSETDGREQLRRIILGEKSPDGRLHEVRDIRRVYGRRAHRGGARKSRGKPAHKPPRRIASGRNARHGDTRVVHTLLFDRAVDHPPDGFDHVAIGGRIRGRWRRVSRTNFRPLRRQDVELVLRPSRWIAKYPVEPFQLCRVVAATLPMTVKPDDQRQTFGSATAIRDEEPIPQHVALVPFDLERQLAFLEQLDHAGLQPCRGNRCGHHQGEQGRQPPVHGLNHGQSGPIRAARSGHRRDSPAAREPRDRRHTPRVAPSHRRRPCQGSGDGCSRNSSQARSRRRDP